MRVLFEIILVIFTVFLLVIQEISFVSASQDTVEAPQQLPFCNDEIKETDKNDGLLYVSTLDGKISALDLLADGSLKWDINTEPGPMISSSIQNLELTNNGQWVRMIPSLSGSIYKFDGDSVEPIPMNADNLLSSSFKFSDDLIISGGKETISYGVSATSGRIIYECSMKGCVNSTTDFDPNELNEEPDQVSPSVIDEDVIVIRRQTQTVRAIEPRSGGERWNFSVSHHELELYESSDCHSSKTNNDLHSFLLDLDIKVIVPDGVICAVRKTAPNIILWKHKFDHPIVNVWKRNDQNKLVTLDLFQVANDLWHNKKSAYLQPPPSGGNGADDDENLMPSVYIGMFKRQLYIQESDQLRMMQLKFIDHMRNGVGEKKSFGRIPWRPIDASSMTQIGHDTDSDEIKSLATTEPNKLEHRNDLETSALSVLYGSEYVNGNGFYLYAKKSNDDKLAICVNEKDSNDSSDDLDNLIVSPRSRRLYERMAPLVNLFPTMSYWWREISLIVLTVLVFNVILTQRKPSRPEVVIVERHVEIKVPATPEPRISDNVFPAIEYHRKSSDSNANESDLTSDFESRFRNEFDLLQCLGKGGFGVVFEVQNKLDDCNYAVKRIALPRKVHSRDRVMREVKTLANCDHQNIVRYFHSWVESPPPGWQDVEDKKWMDRYALSHSIEIESPSTEEPTSNGSDGCCRGSVTTHSYKNGDLNSIISNLHTNECVNFDEVIRKTNFNDNKNNNDDEDDDDSFIVFASDDATEHSTEVDESNALGHSQATTDSDTQDNSRSMQESSMEPSNGIARKKKTVEDRRSQFQQFGAKKRCSSMSDQLVKQTTPNNEFSLNISAISDRWAVISEKPNDTSKSQYKKTHRRPLSLDLTSTGSVKQDVLPELRTNLPASYLYIQMQLCRKQSLKDWILESDPSTRAVESLSIFKQIVEGVEYVHLKGLIHRDLKPSNIFFSLDGQVKIGDFGLVTDMSENLKIITPCGDASGLPSCPKHTAQVGTHLYMSPEQLLGRPYNYKVDIYSLGVILFELLVVFGTEMERIDTIKQLRSNKFPADFSDRFPNEFNLLKMMLGKNPDQRPTTYGIRAREPFSELTNELHHFDLPPRARDSRNSSSSLSSSSGNSSSNFQRSICDVRA